MGCRMQRWYKLLKLFVVLQILVVSYYLQATESVISSFSSCSSDSSLCPQKRPFGTYYMRSSGSNSARSLVGWQDRINNYEIDREDGLWGSYTCASEYQRTFNAHAIAHELFGTSLLSFKGSQVANRTSRDIIADHFGLSTNYEGLLSIKPTIQTWTTELQLYFGLDQWYPGLYAGFQLPLVLSNWDIGAHTYDLHPQPTLFPAGYMGVASIDQITSPIATVANLKEALIGYATFGDKQESRFFGNINFDGKTVVRVANIDTILGWNFLACPAYHLGFNAYFVLPLGNKPCPHTVFSPVAGNQRHYELGAGISGHINLWESSAHNLLALYLEGNCTHLFANTQVRTFDFCHNGPLSRYLLLKQIGQLTPADSNAYNSYLLSGTNWSTRSALVSIPCKGDATLKLAVRASWFGCDIGYNVYGQTAEHVKILPNYPTIYNSQRYSQKGLEGTHYFARTAAPDSVTAVATLNSSSSQTTLFTANLQDAITTDNSVFIEGPASYGYTPTDPPVQLILAPDQYGVNWHTQNSSIAQTAPEAQAANSAAYYSGTGYPNQTNPGPVIIEITDLNPLSAAARSFITHKFFTFLSYNGISDSDPFLGIGGEIEFEWGRRAGAHNQWGVFAKAGMSY